VNPVIETTHNPTATQATAEPSRPASLTLRETLLSPEELAQNLGLSVSTIMASIVSILAPGYSPSLSSKLGLAMEVFSISEKRSAMGSPGDGLTHIHLCDSHGFVPA
jgi:hypothetical protein